MAFGKSGALLACAASAIFAASAFTAAYAAPARPAASATIFSCTTASGTLVRISRTGTLYRYVYGRPGAAPDLTFTVPKSATSIHDGSEDIGSGSWWLTHEVTLRFNGTSYTGWWSYNRASSEEGGGIRVEKGPKTLAETACASEVTIDLNAYE